MRISLTPPQRFAVISLALVIVIVVATSITQFRFYREQIIDRESAVIHDLVDAIVLEQVDDGTLSAEDLKEYRSGNAPARLQESFDALEKLSGAVRIKVFNTDGHIAWSDEPRLVGSTFTRNWKDLARAMKGEVRAVFIPDAVGLDPNEGLPRSELIEFYVPFKLHSGGDDPIAGVTAIYRSPEAINAVIRQGLLLLWLVTGVAGSVLFLALFLLFRGVYYGQQAAESRFAKLSSEHERLMQLEKLSAMGQLLSEIAHQLNNPLVGVVNLAQLAEREADDPSRVRHLLGEVRKAGESCRDFVQRMLSASKVSPSQPRQMEICQLARETVAFFHHSLGGRPPVELRTPADEIDLRADPLLVRNALFNLIHNAAQADPAGKVVVSISRRERSGRAGCDMVVSDSGPGIAAEAREKIFTPFFTTRKGGTGLGLSIARHIAVQHGGHVDADNRPEGGAQFTLWLPLGEAA